jgi:hypothetical protein
MLAPVSDGLVAEHDGDWYVIDDVKDKLYVCVGSIRESCS